MIGDSADSKPLSYNKSVKDQVSVDGTNFIVTGSDLEGQERPRSLIVCKF
jgi:hypothetical protein